MIAFSVLCEKLGCKLVNVRDRWSAYNEEIGRAVFTIWADRLDRSRNRYQFDEADGAGRRAAARDLKRHIDGVMEAGAEAFGILSEAANEHSLKRERKNFARDILLVLRLAREDGLYVAYIVGEVDVVAVLSGRGSVSTRRWTDAIDDVAYEPVGSVISKRMVRTAPVYIRDARIRAAVIKRAAGKCEYCGSQGFRLRNGDRYLEAHHIVALAEQGPDTLENVIALCANHHREAHFGKDAATLESQLARKLLMLRGPR
jgi:5-methylcytosine-specific restriction protein A